MPPAVFELIVGILTISYISLGKSSGYLQNLWCFSLKKEVQLIYLKPSENCGAFLGKLIYPPNHNRLPKLYEGGEF